MSLIVAGVLPQQNGVYRISTTDRGLSRQSCLRVVSSCDSWRSGSQRPSREAGEHGDQLPPHLPLPEGVHQGVDQRVGQPQQPQMILQHFRELTALTQNMHDAHHEEGAPEHREAADEQRHRPQGLDVTPVAASQLLMMLRMLMAVAVAVVGRPGARLSDLEDLLLVVAGDLQDVQVDVDEHGEHGEEADAEQDDHAHLVNDGEEGTEAFVALGLELPHQDWVAGDTSYFTDYQVLSSFNRSV